MKTNSDKELDALAGKANRDKEAKPAKPKAKGKADRKVVAGEKPREVTFRAKIYAMAKTPVTEADLQARAEKAGIPNARGKVRAMLKSGQLKAA